MATNYTVVLFSRQQLGNEAGVFNDVEPNVPFAGRAKDFPFDCPGINPAEAAVLMFQSRDVDHQRNILRVNGVDVFGGLPASPARDAWNGNVLLVEPHHQLKAAGNVLRVEARRADGGSTGDVDYFIIDNVVITYKTLDPVVPQLPTATGDLGAFLTSEIITSITNVQGSGSGANGNDQHNEYVLPTQGQLASWRLVFQSLLAGDWRQAHVRAKAISSTYNVVQFFDTPSGLTHYVLMEGVPGLIPAAVGHPTGREITDPADQTRRGWGTYLFAAQPRRGLSLSAPHIRDDSETENQAIEAYLSLGARTLLIAGTDRDQNKADAPCQQSLRPYKQADVSHTAESVFQMAFEEIYTSDTTTWHLQFHGSGTCSEDVFLSNGVQQAPAPVRALAANIVAASTEAAAGSGPVINARVFDSTGGCLARGTDNMQMRFASGRPHAAICADGNGPIRPSRFIHLEQLRTVRRAATDPEASRGVNRDVVMAAIAVTFP